MNKEQLENKIREHLNREELAEFFGYSKGAIDYNIKKHFGTTLSKLQKQWKCGRYRERDYGNCKVCGDSLKPTQTTYCSNECKFSDDEYNKSRNSSTCKNPDNLKLVCKKTGWETSDYYNLSGAISKHLDGLGIPYDDKYFRHFHVIPVEHEVFKCPECEWTTVDVENKSGAIVKHIETEHCSLLEFLEKWPEYKEFISGKKLDKKKRQKELNDHPDSRIKCEICGKYFRKLSNTHLQKHGITSSEYKLKYGRYNLNFSKTSDLQSELTTQFNYSGFKTSATSSYELDLKDKLVDANIDHVYKFNLCGKEYDFYFPFDNLLVEVDGRAYHSEALKKLTLTQIKTSINDYEKDIIAEENDYILYRIRYDKENFDFNSYDELLEMINAFKYEKSYDISYDQKIVTKEYLSSFIENKGKEKLFNYVPLFLNFVRTFIDDFPLPSSQYDLDTIIKRIRNYDLSSVFDGNSVNNNAWYIGNIYLKSIFKSYWKSAYKNNLSPMDVWIDDQKMMDLIAYRIGYNDHGEIFDFSIRQLLRAIASNRISVSFFKPLVAASIYQYFLGNIDSPVVLDPCAGFGGRMLGFKSIYPNGTYIGLEPNIDTYNELKVLAKNFDDVVLHNLKQEDFELSRDDIDLTFTSIPYHNKEIYSNHVNYGDYDNWKRIFIPSIQRFPNLALNIPSDFLNMFDYSDKFEFVNNASHFSNSNQKIEYIIKCF